MAPSNEHDEFKSLLRQLRAILDQKTKASKKIKEIDYIISNKQIFHKVSDARSM